MSFRLRFLPAVSLLLVTGACAREEMPPGTGPDFEPPRVTEMYPMRATAVPDMDGKAYVRFDEPLADPRSVERTLETSPAWLYDVQAGRSKVEIRPRDGWRPGVVYTFRIPPGLRDLVRNPTREPIEFLFTTGDQFLDTRASGRVWDRESVRPARDASILVTGADSIPYSSVTDTAGAFALLGLPTGTYWAFGYRDQNRNRVLDRGFEPYDSARVELADSVSVVELELWLTPPDSTPPVLGGGEVVDSLTVRLEFDDLLETDMPLDAAFVRITSHPGDEAWPVRDFSYGMAVSRDTAVTGDVPDSTMIGEAVSDSVPPPAVPGDVGPDSAIGGPMEVMERPRPERMVTVRLERALQAGEYSVTTGGFVNLRGLAGGGDTTFVYEPPAVADDEPGEAVEGPPAEAGDEGAEPPEESGAQSSPERGAAGEEARR
jgi:hypothetical protein